MKIYLVVTSGPLAGKAFPVSGGEIIGRDKGTIVLSDPKVSGKHAVVKKSLLGKLYLQDLKSKNGLKVKGQRSEKVYLDLGATFQIGANRFVVADKRPTSMSKSPGNLGSLDASPKPPSEFKLQPEALQKLNLSRGSLSSNPAIQAIAEEFSQGGQPSFPNEAPNTPEDDSTGPLTDLSEIKEKLTRTDHFHEILKEGSLTAKLDESGNSFKPETLDAALDSSLSFDTDPSLQSSLADLDSHDPSTQLINDVLSDLDSLEDQSLPDTEPKNRGAARQAIKELPQDAEQAAEVIPADPLSAPDEIEEIKIFALEQASQTADFNEVHRVHQPLHPPLDTKLPDDDPDPSFGEETIVSPAEESLSDIGDQPEGSESREMLDEGVASALDRIAVGFETSPEANSSRSFDRVSAHQFKNKESSPSDDLQDNSKPGVSISLRTLHEKKQFEVESLQKEQRRRWNLILENYSRERGRAVKNQPKSLEPFHHLIKMTFFKGLQAETEWVLGYGPRFVGKGSADLPLLDEAAPGDISFSFHPHGGTAIFRTQFPNEVKVNGRSLIEVEIQHGDVITLNQTEIEIEFLK